MNIRKHLPVRPFIFIATFLSVSAFFSCTKTNPPQPSTSSSNSSLWTYHSLAGQQWKFTQYHDEQMTTIVTANDTLIFTDDTHYTWNGVPATYRVYEYDGDGYTHFVFDNSPFGAMSALVPHSFDTYGQLNDVKFSNTTQSYYMWFVKIP